MRSHYGENAKADGEKIYRAGNALAEWLGFDSWIAIPEMQRPENIDEFRKLLKKAT